MHIVLLTCFEQVFSLFEHLKCDYYTEPYITLHGFHNIIYFIFPKLIGCLELIYSTIFLNAQCFTSRSSCRLEQNEGKISSIDILH